MRITCIGHSGFAIESASGDATLVFDYYIDRQQALRPILERSRGVYVFVSHSHRDHLCHDIFGWRDHYPIVRYVMANECRRKLARSMDLAQWPMTFLHHDEDWHDDLVHVHAFNSTDVGVSFLVDFDGLRLFHAGDYTCWQFEGAPQAELRKAQGDFHAILRTIAAYAPHMDVAMMPVVPNLGGDYCYGSRELLRAVSCDLFIPMHTWGRDREATQFHLYRNPLHGECCHLPEGTSLEWG
ncbi:MAG: MBL fold metallo-hydrolase [Muribaculaceae bacterium]|nr:MBL fold metallo-hydrolase [Muribaculaceae bacterium]